jgi:hypothetical protein
MRRCTRIAGGPRFPRKPGSRVPQRAEQVDVPDIREWMAVDDSGDFSHRLCLRFIVIRAEKGDRGQYAADRRAGDHVKRGALAGTGPSDKRTRPEGAVLSAGGQDQYTRFAIGGAPPRGIRDEWRNGLPRRRDSAMVASSDPHGAGSAVPPGALGGRGHLRSMTVTSAAISTTVYAPTAVHSCNAILRIGCMIVTARATHGGLHWMRPGTVTTYTAVSGELIIALE